MAKSLRVLLVNQLTSAESHGGAERSIDLLRTSLTEYGCEAKLFSLGTSRSTTSAGWVEKALPSVPAFVKSASLAKLATHLLSIVELRYLASLATLIDEWKPDVVHTNNIGRMGVLVWKLIHLKGIPLVHTPRDYFLLSPTEFHSSREQTVLDLIFSAPKRALSGSVDGVVGISRFILADHLRSGYFPNARAIEVIHNSVALPTRPQRNSERGSAPVFGYVGALAPRKGVEVLLADAKRLAERYPFKLLVAGSGAEEYRRSLERLWCSNYVEFNGFISPGRIYSQIDWLIVPSLWHEPFGRIIPEANSYGVPVIAHAVGGIPEIVLHKKTGILYGKGTEFSTLYGAMSFVLEKEESGCASEACREFAGTFNAEIGMKKHLKLYNRLIRSGWQAI